MLSIDDDAVEALQAARPVVERWARSGLFPRLTELAGIGADGQGPLKDEQLSLMTVAGTPANCAEAVRRWEDAGVDDLVLLARDPDADDQVDRFARQVLAQRER
jgi:alkanesulfonate monooxygenase SsuD/methylene tetrahydromethanopterin reductase-like flavin-dependent oxidoreductase (luciferase family)